MHLRFGAVARGGLRWSDRREDFRTEVLGLVKAQMVKNTVIVPVGAKGGFVLQAAARPAGDRDALAGRGHRLLPDVHLRRCSTSPTTWSTARSCRPTDVVRHDGDDPYLVVAADKGTATFSDIANGVAKDYGFWLGDAFASGGSVGYDHKAMGITARGAWESVQRHFRELRHRHARPRTSPSSASATCPATCSATACCCSEHIRLVAAFDHRAHLPRPDPDAGDVVRRAQAAVRPAALVAGQDYDTRADLRGRRRLPAHAEVDPAHRRRCATALGIDDDVAAMTPAELMRAILQAPVDLLWNGGIGTYVKAATETARRRRRQGQRRDPGQRRASCARRCVGEGGNLGLTQLGRIEYAARGGPDQHRLHRQLGRASTPPTTRSTSRSCSTGWSRDGDLTAEAAQRRCSPR